MGDFIKEIVDNGEKLISELPVTGLIDPLLLYARDFVEKSLITLTEARTYLREKEIEDGRESYNKFRSNCEEYLASIDSLKELLDGRENMKKVVKVVMVADEILSKSTIRTVNTKLPTPSIKYLVEDGINESDIDWIIKKLKDYWGKFLQVYGSTRMDIIVSNAIRNK
ncbi:MAG: hypothetical protein AAFN93_23340 [Bacteroidota bacterium]